MPRRRPDPQLTGKPPATATKIGGSQMLPLDYMLAVIRDESADPARRDRLAICAVQYTHPKLVDAVGKKDQRAEAARLAGGAETEWASDLDVDSHQPQ